MRAPDPREAARALVHSRVKVCGLTDPHDAGLAVECGATYLGLIMVPNTPRAVTLAKAEGIAAAVPGHAARRRVPRRGRAARSRRPRARSACTPSSCTDARMPLHRRAPPRSAGRHRDLGRRRGRRGPARRAPGADRTLFDTALAGQSGGTGQASTGRASRGRPDLAAAFSPAAFPRPTPAPPPRSAPLRWTSAPVSSWPPAGRTPPSSPLSSPRCAPRHVPLSYKPRDRLSEGMIGSRSIGRSSGHIPDVESPGGALPARTANLANFRKSDHHMLCLHLC
jgi:hypothetical protein